MLSSKFLLWILHLQICCWNQSGRKRFAHLRLNIHSIGHFERTLLFRWRIRLKSIIILHSLYFIVSVVFNVYKVFLFKPFAILIFCLASYQIVDQVGVLLILLFELSEISFFEFIQMVFIISFSSFVIVNYWMNVPLVVTKHHVSIVKLLRFFRAPSRSFNFVFAQVIKRSFLIVVNQLNRFLSFDGYLSVLWLYPLYFTAWPNHNLVSLIASLVVIVIVSLMRWEPIWLRDNWLNLAHFQFHSTFQTLCLASSRKEHLSSFFNHTRS